jgi:IS5 family transposase
VLQLPQELPDRAVAEAALCRIDFKYALALGLDDPGFHHSVLTDFRNRLSQEGRADRLLDLALAQLKDAGRSPNAAGSAPSPSMSWPRPLRP